MSHNQARSPAELLTSVTPFGFERTRFPGYLIDEALPNPSVIPLRRTKCLRCSVSSVGQTG